MRTRELVLGLLLGAALSAAPLIAVAQAPAAASSAPATGTAAASATSGAPAVAAEGGGEAAAQGFGSDWSHWRAGNSVADLASLQRGAKEFLNYCNGCHSLKYMRYSRLGQDLEIPPDVLQQDLVPANRKASDYITSPMPPADAEAWFGKAPPDLSLMARERGTDYLYQFLMTFFVDPSRPTGANNLRLPATSMPAVLSEVEGLKRAVFKNQVFDHFEPLAAGSMSREQYEGLVRDIVNFLDYVGEPAQVHRRALGVWVVLFLLVFTWLAWLLKKEYWKDVH